MAKIRNEYLYTKNSFYHIYNRGNNKKVIFYEVSDYKRFICRLFKYVKDYDLDIYAYCLMPNHFHLLLKLGENKNDI